MIHSLFDRTEYPVLDNNVYLNQASLGLIGQPAVKAMHEFLDDVGRHGNLRMSDKDEISFFNNLRSLGAKLMHCSPSQLAIIGGASEMLGQLPYMIRPERGSNIVAVSSDFPAVTRPWIGYADKNSCFLRYAGDQSSQNLTDQIIDRIDNRTSVVTVSLVQYSTGSMIDVVRLRQATTHVDAKLIIDVTQAAGTVEVEFDRWRADAVVTSGYKWLGGHGGIAIAAIAPHFLKNVPPLLGWMGAESPFDFNSTWIELAGDARRYTKSTMSYISMAGLAAALENLILLEKGAAERHARSLASELIEGVAPAGWKPFRNLSDPSASPHIISLSHSEIDAEKAIDQLRERNIYCGIRNGRIRVSLALYNNSSDIQSLVTALGAT